MIGPHPILSVGTQVVALAEVKGPGGTCVHPRGAVGVIAQAPADLLHAYRVRFSDGFEAAMKRQELAVLAGYQMGEPPVPQAMFEYVIYRCVIGSRAYGLDGESSDTDRRGIYLPPAEVHWSLYGVPEQVDGDGTEETYWELQKFLMLALKANPNILECLYSPIVEHATPLAMELIGMREAFLSKLVYQTYSGYVMSQFKKLTADLRNHGAVKWKHVMHLIRLLLSGVTVLREGHVPVRISEHRDQLLAVRRGEVAWHEIDRWRVSLHEEFDRAFAGTKLPDRPDYEKANAFLLKARRSMVSENRGNA